MPRYVGIDQSAEAVLLARQTRDGAEFLVGTLHDTALAADLTVCLDVLIYQPSSAAYRDLVGRLLRPRRRPCLSPATRLRPSPALQRSTSTSRSRVHPTLRSRRRAPPHAYGAGHRHMAGRHRNAGAAGANVVKHVHGCEAGHPPAPHPRSTVVGCYRHTPGCGTGYKLHQRLKTRTLTRYRSACLVSSRTP